MTKPSALLAALLALATAAQGQSRMLVDEVVATVGDDAVLSSDIEYAYGQAMIEGANYAGDMRCHLLEQLLIQKLMVNQARIDSVEVKDADVMQQVDARMNYFVQQVGGQDKLEEYFNKPYQQIRRDQVEATRTQMIQQRMQAEIVKDVKVTPAEIRQYYETLGEDSIPLVPAQYELQQIVVYPEVEQAEIDRVKDRLRDFQKQVAGGRDFATLAVLYSEDPGSAARGGDLGWYSRSGFVPEFSAVAFNMNEPGKVSKIVETEFGYHIIQFLERKGDRIHCRHILLKPKVSAQSRQKARTFLDTVTVMINDGRIKFEQAAMRFSMDKDSRSNGGSLVNPEDGTKKFQLSQIPAEVAKAVQGLPEGQLSKPFAMVDERRGKETLRLARLVKRHEPHRANVADDFDLLRRLLEADKRKRLLDQWILNKRQELFVTVTPDWLECDFDYPGWGA